MSRGVDDCRWGEESAGTTAGAVGYEAAECGCGTAVEDLVDLGVTDVAVGVVVEQGIEVADEVEILRDRGGGRILALLCAWWAA